jgi:magnesium and cobalt exporter, CNNM family
MNWNMLNGFVFAICLVASFLLSGMEAGVFALNRLRVRRLARAGKPSAKLLNRFLENPENFLWTILVGNTLANFLVLGLLIAKLHQWFPGQQSLIIVIFAAITFLFYALFDLLPKMLFRANPNQLCLGAASIFRPVHFILHPFVLAVEGVSATLLRWTGGRAFTGRLFGNREEMLAVMQESAQSLTGDERVMINRILDLQKFTVRQIATPLAQTITAETQAPAGVALTLARQRNFFRLPVMEMRDGQPRIAGLLALGALLFRENLDWGKPVATYMTPALFVDENMRLETALRRMQRAGQRLAVVLANDRREIGVVSLEDILKVMFGEVKL